MPYVVILQTTKKLKINSSDQKLYLKLNISADDLPDRINVNFDAKGLSIFLIPLSP